MNRKIGIDKAGIPTIDQKPHSRFPNLIKYIASHEEIIPEDLWGLIYGYPTADIHQFTYDWEEWAKKA
jgi:hypothetical protein